VVLQAEDNEISRNSKPHRTLRKEVMLVTANARCTTIVVGSLAKSTVGKRPNPVWNTRPGTERISKRTVPLVTSVASDRRSKAEVIQRAREGDRSAFEYLDLAYPRVYTLCLRMIGDPTEAEDLTQEPFLLLFRKIYAFRGESAL